MNWDGIGALAVAAACLLFAGSIAKSLQRSLSLRGVDLTSAAMARAIVAPAFIAGGIAGLALAVAWASG